MFATCIHYHYRQLSIYICKKLIEDENLFMEITFDLIEDLSFDNVLNVRVTLGYFLNKAWTKKQAPFRWIKTNKFDEVKNTLKDINIEDAKKELNYNDYSKIMIPKNVNETFNNKCEELNVLLGFIPTIYKVK